MIYLAAGSSRRFGSNKLYHEIAGKPMFQYGLDMLCRVLEERRDTTLVAVTNYDLIKDYVQRQKETWQERIRAVDSPYSEEGISRSIRAGLENPDADYYLFCVADQPCLLARTVLELIRRSTEGSYAGGYIEWNGIGGNPAIFSRDLLPELLALQGDKGGKSILKNRTDICRVTAGSAQELKDLDLVSEGSKFVIVQTCLNCYKDLQSEKPMRKERRMAMNFLEERIVKDGIVKEGNVLKVDSFLNHQMDIELLERMGEEFKRRFADAQIDKILTIEASGIGIACIAARYFQVPVVFAKKAKSINIDGEMYIAEVESFTHKCKNQVIVSKKFLKPGEHVLIIDDFLANGCALQGLISIVGQAGASVEGIGIAIEKGFQSGGRTIRNLGYHLESLAIVDGMDASTGEITFREQ